MSLLDDLAAPSGHSAVQQALANAVWIRVCQLRDVVDGFQSQDLNALTVTLKLRITLKNTQSQIYNKELITVDAFCVGDTRITDYSDAKSKIHTGGEENNFI